MLSAIIRYTEDTTGLEKTLRLFHGLCTVAVGLVHTQADAEGWANARSHLALGRRYFRLLKWHPCWIRAYASLTGNQSSPIKTVLEVSKWSFLGMYFFLEAFTITNNLGATSYKWGPWLQQEAFKCWFYALTLSLLASFYELATMTAPVSPPADSVDKPNVAKEKSKENSETPKPPAGVPINPRARIYTQLAIDLCDILIPGSALGWIPIGPIILGLAMSIGSLIAGQQIWQRVQPNASRN